FEAGRESVGKKGIVRDPKVHEDVLRRMVSFSASEGYLCKGLSFSPITGGDGNIEFLLHLQWPSEGQEGAGLPEEEISRIVEEAHRTLKEKKADVPE
ncbi:TlyA family rRNA (cytidine-2'-O)-methyltransferase, partial [Bacillus mojavensis]|nr:TlyA family rRNA (cytidine-2'-O)-methyltransferase [Bacillus mojavensis]